ncbi:GspH/FimT family pseudopilin [Bacterioplanoides pacificum]|uniref:Type II secretion system protein H n=1 Tax=Bacterioplanoides pacificum TaxID=1171596 RepID=A0ABV7VP95_9GAMM
MDKGFTLVELVMVLIILGIVAAVTSARFSSPQNYSSRVIADQLLASARLAQQTALSRSASGDVTMQLARTADNWRLTIRGGTTIVSDIAAGNENIRAGVDLAVSCNALASLPLLLSYDGNGNLLSGQNTRICIQDNNRVRELCISRAGYAYEGPCVL